MFKVISVALVSVLLASTAVFAGRQDKETPETAPGKVCTEEKSKEGSKDADNPNGTKTGDVACPAVTPEPAEKQRPGKKYGE